MLEICRKNSEYVFLVREDGEERWASHMEMLQDYAQDLIRFYEKHAIFTEKKKGFSRK